MLTVTERGAMKLNRGLKVALFGLTLWPVLYIVLFLLVMMSGPGAFGIILPLHMLTMLLVLGLTIFYIVHIFKSPRPEGMKKIMWLVLILWANIAVMPFYFWFYVWKAEPLPSPA